MRYKLFAVLMLLALLFVLAAPVAAQEEQPEGEASEVVIIEPVEESALAVEGELDMTALFVFLTGFFELAPIVGVAVPLVVALVQLLKAVGVPSYQAGFYSAAINFSVWVIVGLAGVAGYEDKVVGVIEVLSSIAPVAVTFIISTVLTEKTYKVVKDTGAFRLRRAA